MRNIRRGTTENFSVTLGIDLTNAEKLSVIFSQKGKVVLEKELPDCSVEDNAIAFELSEEETLKFDCKQNPLQMQVRLKSMGRSLATGPHYMWVLPISKGGCL